MTIMGHYPNLQLPTPFASCCQSCPPVEVLLVSTGGSVVSVRSAVAPLIHCDAGRFEGCGEFAWVVAGVLIPIDPGVLST